MENKRPLSPHIQIYRWHISSLVSISHRITGIINIIAISLVCFLACVLMLGEESFKIIEIFFNSFFGKFIILGITWSFSFQILSEKDILLWIWVMVLTLKLQKSQVL